MIKGYAISDNGRMVYFELEPLKSLTINGVNHNPEEMYHFFQVVRLIDAEMFDVAEYRIEPETEWKKYRANDRKSKTD